MKHTVTNLGDTDIKVHMEDGWHIVQPGAAVSGVLFAVNNGKERTRYRVEAFKPAIKMEQG